MLVPKHLAIIMDGNRRWARKKGLKVFRGHQYVVDNVMEPLIENCVQKGIEYLTLWAFSTENWKRSKTEVSFLLKLFRIIFSSQAERLHKKEVRIQTIGDLSRFPKDIQDLVAKWKKKTKDNKRIILTIAINYGGRDEIVRAVSKLIKDVQNGEGELKEKGNFHTNKKWLVNETLLAKYMDTADIPDPELIIRTSGEQRMSGFLTWSGVYSEYYFTDTLMPDFDEKELDKAIEEYNARNRRFGC
jgi:undecaprenyl diphosphate synthase